MALTLTTPALKKYPALEEDKQLRRSLQGPPF